MEVSEQIKYLRDIANLTQRELACLLGTSLIAVDRLERGSAMASPSQIIHLGVLITRATGGKCLTTSSCVLQNGVFASRGATRKATNRNPLDISSPNTSIVLSDTPLLPLLSRLKHGTFLGKGKKTLQSLLCTHSVSSPSSITAFTGGTSAGKNTYTYDAHTYHTKVPPQGIVEFLRYYLPNGGLVLDPFAGSGMTGVAARAMGYDVILNEISPAASFISYNFTKHISRHLLSEAVKFIVSYLASLRHSLYSTTCRECGKETEILYTVWSYRVVCHNCLTEFLLWDYCRKYGRTVKEHKILSEFPCPSCGEHLKKRSLSRTEAEPVLLGYKCCSRVQVEHTLTDMDLAVLLDTEEHPPLADGFFPTTPLPNGVNLNQPKKHGLTSIDRFYTKRNLAALSHIWREIHRIEDVQLASFVAFVFTSLYQRVTRLSEYRFWGGSGNTAHFNVPFIFNEANIFVTFERKAATILDHIEMTAENYSGKCVVACHTATDLNYLPDNSIDFIFTDPPFGANINYSEMNILWESWLGEFTDATNEAIVNRLQKKGANEYEELMTQSLKECYRVLRPGHWMLLIFMNSSAKVWEAIKSAVKRARFIPERIDIFDKQHGTFKQFVSDNVAGYNLVLHCRKHLHDVNRKEQKESLGIEDSINSFLQERDRTMPETVYLHVSRKTKTDFSMLYSEWISYGLLRDDNLADFATFREISLEYLKNIKGKKQNDQGSQCNAQSVR